ncbi:unnamed protein product [Linum trigynum]|uniref:Uncharacterized protein n=1 Tax=Linum trigynum TaxID=586398 RepID=A0AAV2FR33_9ROSI
MSPRNPLGQFPVRRIHRHGGGDGTLAVDSFATAYFSKAHGQEEENRGGAEDPEERGEAHTHATHGHSHGAISAAAGGPSSGEAQLIRHRVISQVLEVGIVVHSVIIGISLGASESPKTVRPLLAALTFHQFFEGMGLGGCIAQAKFKSRGVAMMVLFFSVTTPLGIGIGMGISNVYKENSPTALIVEGVFNSASSGILIYMALVDLLAADFMHPKVQASGRLQIGVQIALLLGAGFMSLLAIWA